MTDAVKKRWVVEGVRSRKDLRVANGTEVSNPNPFPQTHPALMKARGRVEGLLFLRTSNISTAPVVFELRSFRQFGCRKQLLIELIEPDLIRNSSQPRQIIYIMHLESQSTSDNGYKYLLLFLNGIVP